MVCPPPRRLLWAEVEGEEMNCKEISFAGKKAFEIKTEIFRMIIISEYGPRIASWGRVGGENLLFWNEKDLGRGDWKLRGGHRVWAIRPDADESEDAYRPDNDPCEVKKIDASITITGHKDSILQTRRGIRLEIAGDNRIYVDNFITNAGDMLYSAGVWALTCTNPALKRSYGIPLGDDSEWDCFNFVMFRKWAGHTSLINDPQISFTEGMLILTPQGIETKRMIEAPYGIMAMDAPDQDTTFVKKVDYNRAAQYPLGCNIAFYVAPDNFMVEMESMGSEVTLKPGETVHSRETWVLTEKAIGLEDRKKVINLFQ